MQIGTNTTTKDTVSVHYVTGKSHDGEIARESTGQAAVPGNSATGKSHGGGVTQAPRTTR